MTTKQNVMKHLRTTVMSTLVSSLVSIWFSLLLVQVMVEATGPELELPFKPPCSVRRTEIVFPFVSDTRGRYVTSPTTSINSGSNSSTPTTSRQSDFMLLTVTWRRKNIQLVLQRNNIAPSGSAYEWRDGNTTYGGALEDNCLYQGFVRDQASSYAAVSVCEGVAGYIQTDEEILFIEPAKEGSASPRDHVPHYMYTCEQQETVISLAKDTFADSSDSPYSSLHEQKKRRQRRQAGGRTKHLEILMAIDPSVVRIVGRSKIKLYVMTLMNIVNSIYQHHTLGVDIKVHLVKLVILDNADVNRIMVERDAFRTVQQFCMWSMAKYDPYAPSSVHDISVFLTRGDLGPAGYAPITGLCNPVRSCAAIKDEGFTSAFIIAHEMAHVFGLHHDGHGNRCYGSNYRSAIMASLVESKFNHYWWSDCSKERMRQVIDYLYCLDDEPNPLKTMPPVPARLGSGWTFDVQCALEFGKEFVLCRAFHADPCGMLWCADRKQVSLCRTKRGPPIEGTQCGNQRQCLNQKCTYIGDQSPVNGQWTVWSSWTKCNTDCGVGIKHRTRTCDNPSPAYGGNDCDGSTEEWDTCKSDNCEWYSDLKQLECQVWNDLRIRPGKHTWLPYQTRKKEDYCKQTCMSAETKEIVTLDIDSGDGTPCSYDNPYNICMGGKCLKVGCDGVRDSDKKPDACGICGGDSSQCKTVSGEYTRVPEHGDQYETVIYIPKGARNMEITKTKASPQFIALKDPDHGFYILNGDKRQSRSQEFAANGAWFSYARGRTYESLVSKGPLMKNLEVMMYAAGHMENAAITYQFTINKKDNTVDKMKFEWKFYKWSDCSVTCGTGVVHIIYKCHSRSDGEEVNEEMCSFLEAPRADQAPCQRQTCTESDTTFGWAMAKEYGECSATCGEEGTQKQLFTCERRFPDGKYEPAEFDLCKDIEEPNHNRACNRLPCALNWTAEAWGQCSRSCGAGIQKRKVFCGNPDTIADDNLCEGDPPARTKICSNKCDAYKKRKICIKDKFKFCRVSSARKCKYTGYRLICCKSCQKFHRAAHRKKWSRLARFRMARRSRKTSMRKMP